MISFRNISVKYNDEFIISGFSLDIPREKGIIK